MTTNTLREALFKLTAAERMELVEELWDSIADDDDALALTDAQREGPGATPGRSGRRSYG